VITSIAWPLLAATAVADSGIPPAADLFRGFEIAGVQLSPDGRYISAVTRQYGLAVADNLVIRPIDASGPTRLLTDYRFEFDVGFHLWAGPTTLLFQRLRGRDEPRYLPTVSGLFAVDIESGDMRPIDLPSGYRLAHVPARRNGSVLLWLYARGRPFPSAAWLDAERGVMNRLIDPEPGVIGWYADHRQRIRASLLAGDQAGPGKLALRYRESERQSWRTVLPLQIGTADFQGFDQDNAGLWVLAAEDDRVALYRADPRSGGLGTAVAADPHYDLRGTLLQDPDGRALEFTYMADRPRRVVLDAGWGQHCDRIDSLLPATFNAIVDWDEGMRRLLVRASSDRNPGAYYIFETGSGQLRFIGASAPWLHRQQLSGVEPISFEARDGLPLHGYYTPPVGHDGHPAPMILMPHGGPFGVRDQWGFDPRVQFLASRGYGVLQVNYRGSGGYGKRFEQAGYGQWGLAMQDDLSDAVVWAVTSGRADPDQVCIFGASYGGYAALMGLIKTPGLYRCGISFAGISDRLLMYRNDRLRFNNDAQESFIQMFGDPESDPEVFEATSPVHHVERIRAPLLVAHGQLDAQVDIRHYRLLTRQLRKHGKQFETFERRFEGHGLVKETNVLAFYETLADFLARRMPTSRNPSPTMH
jgi:dipeptidyl aminopeptidase/acylaminoacyl peptidase